MGEGRVWRGGIGLKNRLGRVADLKTDFFICKPGWSASPDCYPEPPRPVEKPAISRMAHEWDAFPLPHRWTFFSLTSLLSRKIPVLPIYVLVIWTTIYLWGWDHETLFTGSAIWIGTKVIRYIASALSSQPSPGKRCSLMLRMLVGFFRTYIQNSNI